MRDRFPTAPLVDPTRHADNDSGWQRGSWDSVIMDFGDPACVTAPGSRHRLLLSPAHDGQVR